MIFCIYAKFFVPLQQHFCVVMNDIIQYIITFLLYDNSKATKNVGYTSDETQWHKYSVVILPNGHLGKEITLPDLTQPIVDSITTKQLQKNEQHEESEESKQIWIIRTDLIYNTFFFISRAEELINPKRDEHGRFNAKHSILGHSNRLMIPLIDEYSRLLMKLLDLPLPTPKYSQIYLTHDVDSIDYYRHLRGTIGGIIRGRFKAVIDSLKNIHNDPAFTFPWLVSQDKKITDAKIIYFIKNTLGKGYDYPQYNLQGKDYNMFKQLICCGQAQIGLHSSYYGHININHIPQPSLHRSHYLRCSIDQMQRLVDAGITDDFTMMFPDQIGFRLQTARAVRWINPKTMTLTALNLHPLTVMDCTLSNTNYMNLNEDEAYFECQRLFEKVYQNSGEIVLLWHNTTPSNNSYHYSLYSKLLNMLASNNNK